MNMYLPVDSVDLEIQQINELVTIRNKLTEEQGIAQRTAGRLSNLGVLGLAPHSTFTERETEVNFSETLDLLNQTISRRVDQLLEDYPEHQEVIAFVNDIKGISVEGFFSNLNKKSVAKKSTKLNASVNSAKSTLDQIKRSPIDKDRVISKLNLVRSGNENTVLTYLYRNKKREVKFLDGMNADAKVVKELADFIESLADSISKSKKSPSLEKAVKEIDFKMIQGKIDKLNGVQLLGNLQFKLNKDKASKKTSTRWNELSIALTAVGMAGSLINLVRLLTGTIASNIFPLVLTTAGVLSQQYIFDNNTKKAIAEYKVSDYLKQFEVNLDEISNLNKAIVKLTDAVEGDWSTDEEDTNARALRSVLSSVQSFALSIAKISTDIANAQLKFIGHVWIED